MNQAKEAKDFHCFCEIVIVSVDKFLYLIIIGWSRIVRKTVNALSVSLVTVLLPNSKMTSINLHSGTEFHDMEHLCPSIQLPC